MRLAALALLCAAISCACGLRDRKATCDWPPNYTFANQGIEAEIRLGEDIAIRFADAQGYRETWRSVRIQCESKLFGELASATKMPLESLRIARSGLDRRGFDWTVNLPMAAFCLMLSLIATRRIRRRFDNDRIAAWLAVLIVSFFIATLVVLSGQVWAQLVEMMRIGNGHLSYRAERIAWPRHRLEIWMLAFICVWSVAWLNARTKVS